MKQLSRILTALLLASQSLPLYAAKAIPPINALWNESNGFGIWIYPGTGTCPEIRARLKSFLVIGPGKPIAPGEQKTLNSAELLLCANLVAGAFKASCKAGELQLKYHSATSEYTGSYEFTLSDGSTQKGSFRAQYCEPGY